MSERKELQDVLKSTHKNMRSIMDSSRGYEANKHDITIIVGGDTHKLQYHADMHDGLEKFIEDQIKMAD